MQAHTQEPADPQAGVATAHPAADIFPVMVGAEFDALLADIRENGQREPIVLHDGLVLDGRNRLRACQELGRDPITTTWNGEGTAEAFVLSMNLHRRHLSQSERALVAAKLANLKMGDNQHTGKEGAQICAASQEAAAKVLNVSRRSVQHAAKVIEKGAPQLVQAVESGVMAVSKAAKLTKLSKARQQEVATSPGKAKRAARRLDREKAAEQQRTHTEDLARDDRPVQFDPEFQAEADVAARDIEFERAERIALGGADALAAENEKLLEQVTFLERRIDALNEENAELKRREKMWEERASDPDWKGRADA